MAFVLSSLSGNLISAASAGYAPTNSGDVSAIASAYQVVSATATQLNAGTAYLTSVNETPISAARAGNAANASLANSAWYDGTGRFISSLPDEATVSSIASSYAESAVSSKADDSALSAYALSSDVSGCIDTVSSNSASWGGGATGDYVEKSAMEVAIGSGNDVSATSFAFGENNSASSRSFTFGSYCIASGSSIALGNSSLASSNSMGVGYSAKSTNRSLSLGNRASANMNSIAVGNYSQAGDNSLAVGNNAVASLESIAVGTYCHSLRGYARGRNNSGYFAFMDGTSLRVTSATAFGTCNFSGNNDSAIFVIGDGTDSATGRHDLMTISRDGEITLYSSTADTTGTGIMSAIRAISAAATGGVDSATVSSIASSYAESAVSSKQDALTFGYNADDQISSIDGSALGGMDEAAVSAIASSYAESAASSKQDTLTFGYDDSTISSINGSAIAGGGGATGNYLTAVIGSDRARIATAFQDGNNNRPSLLISAEREAARSTWPRMILTDWNRTTGLNHSGMLLADGFEFYQCPDSAYGQVNPSGIKRARLDPTDLTFIVDTAISSDNHYAKYGRQGLWMTPTAGSATSILISSDTSVGPFIQLNDNSGLSGRMSVSSIDYWNGKADSSALSSYALSADVSGTVDLVSTQSANWGGSALALSAGPGVTLSKSGDTLTVSTETVLWSGTPVTVDAATAGLTLAESPYNFDRVALYWVPWDYTAASIEKQEAIAEAKITSAIPRIGSVTEWYAAANNTMFIFSLDAYFDSSKFYTKAIKYFDIGGWSVNTNGNGSYITKIVGINRTAEA